MLAIKWNTDDWWPAVVVGVREGGTQLTVEYTDDERSHVDMGWPEQDAYVLNDDEVVEYDSDDAELLEDADEASKAPPRPRSPPKYRTTSESSSGEEEAESDSSEDELDGVVVGDSDSGDGSGTEVLTEGNTGSRGRGRGGKRKATSTVPSKRGAKEKGERGSGPGGKKGPRKAKQGKADKSAKGKGTTGKGSKERKGTTKQEQRNKAGGGSGGSGGAGGGGRAGGKGVARSASLDATKEKGVYVDPKVLRAQQREKAKMVRLEVGRKLQSVLALSAPPARAARAASANGEPHSQKLERLAKEIEMAIYQYAVGLSSGGGGADGEGEVKVRRPDFFDETFQSEYKRKLRQLAFNLRKNVQLREHVLAGTIAPVGLVKVRRGGDGWREGRREGGREGGGGEGGRRKVEYRRISL